MMRLCFVPCSFLLPTSFVSNHAFCLFIVFLSPSSWDFKSPYVLISLITEFWFNYQSYYKINFLLIVQQFLASLWIERSFWTFHVKLQGKIKNQILFEIISSTSMLLSNIIFICILNYCPSCIIQTIDQRLSLYYITVSSI